MHTIANLRTAIEEYRTQHVQNGSPASLYTPVEYAMDQPGKRVRPVMLLLAYSLYRNDVRPALPAALALEYFHNFTLVHDDIMDAAMVRRGRKSVHARFGTNPAILAGDLMLIRSYDLLLSACAEANPAAVLGEFSDMATRICEGQQLDMDFEQRDDVGVVDYLLMVEKKTAVLLGTALHLGAVLAGAGQSEAEALQDIGVNLGKAFQIQDDILDVYGDEALVGKRRGGDIIQKKKSILYALAWESSSGVDRRDLSELYNASHRNPEVKIQQVLTVFDRRNVHEKAEAVRAQLYREGMEALDRLVVPATEQLVILRDFLQGMMKRES